MPNINPNRPIRPAPPPVVPRPIQFEIRTPESFARGGFVNTTPAQARPNPDQAPINPAFINLTPRDFLPPRPELRIDTTVGGGRPVGVPNEESHHGNTTISARSTESGRHAPMHPGLGGSSGSSGGFASASEAGFQTAPSPGPYLGPFTDTSQASSTPSLSSRGSSAISRDPGTPWGGHGDNPRILGEDHAAMLHYSRTPTPEMELSPEPMAYPMPLPRPGTPTELIPRSETPSPASTSSSSRPYPVSASEPGSLPSGSVSPYGYAPTPGVHESAPTPAAYMSPTPGMENAAHLLLSLNPSPTPSTPPTHAPTPGGWYAPTPGGYLSSPSPRPESRSPRSDEV